MPKDLDPPVNFDLERMKASLASGTISFPRGLGRARQQYLRDNNKRFEAPPVKEFHGAECVRGLILG